MKSQRFQIIVVGSGFAGSIISIVASRLGLSTLLIDRGKHPRFVIGESTTPLTNFFLDEIGREYDLGFLRPFSKWGSWQRTYPQIACGLKRGFTFYHHTPGCPFEADPRRQRQLLVGASPVEEVSDTHWYRPEFDQFLVQQAQAIGVTYYDQAEVTNLDLDQRGAHLQGKRLGENINVQADFLIDATGPRGFLYRTLSFRDESFSTLPKTQALFSHFRNVGVLPAEFGAENPGVPYPPEQAAVHHVFDGGWVWVLKFNNGITSAGVAATDALANKLNLAEGAPGWKRFLSFVPSIGQIFQNAQAILPFVHQPRVGFQSSAITGPNWALLPSAAGVIDPLLSTGFPLTLLGIKRVARLLKENWGAPSFSTGLKDYAGVTKVELNATAQLVGALYSAMDRFPLFKMLSLLYFASASFSENALRLGKRHLADGFLLSGNPIFSDAMKSACERAHYRLSTDETERLCQDIREAIAPYDVIGLTDDSRHPWYPALTSDLLRTAGKLGVSSDELALSLGV